MPEGNSSFSKSVPDLQIAWDSTSLGALKKCPRFYYYYIVCGFAPRGENVHLRFGILFHGALERYDHARLAGAEHDEAVNAAIRWTLEETWDTELQRPWVSDSQYKNRYTLLRTIIFYLDRFSSDPMETIKLENGKPAVELSFRLDLDYTAHMSGETFMLCGHLDRLVQFQNDVYIMDRKTTQHALDDRYFSQYSPDNQMSLYAFGGAIVYGIRSVIRGLIIDAAQVLVNDSRFERRQIARNESQLEEWHRDLGFWLTTAQQHARARYWPMNDKACFGCQYRNICSKPPSARPDWLKAEFQPRIWDPLQVRGDV